MPKQSGTIIEEGGQWYVADGNGMMHPTEAPSSGAMYWADGEYHFVQADGSNSEVLWKSVPITAGVMQPVTIRVAVDSNGNDINVDGQSIVHPDDGKTYLGAVDKDYIYNGGQSMDGKAGMILVEGGSSLAFRTANNQAVFNQILTIPKGARPNPSTYLSQEYISTHLVQFEGGVTKFYANAPTGAAGPPGGTFVMPKAVADNLIAQAGGDVAKLEKFLGLERGTLGTNPVRVDISSPSGLRMPSGNEIGANLQWKPGGYTSGGIPEATINAPQLGEYILKTIF